MRESLGNMTGVQGKYKKRGGQNFRGDLIQLEFTACKGLERDKGVSMPISLLRKTMYLDTLT